jgi:hypothetical protein
VLEAWSLGLDDHKPMPHELGALRDALIRDLHDSERRD